MSGKDGDSVMVVTAVKGLRHMLARSRGKQASSVASQQQCLFLRPL